MPSSYDCQITSPKQVLIFNSVKRYNICCANTVPSISSHLASTPTQSYVNNSNEYIYSTCRNTYIL